MKEIAGILGITPRTVERHVLHIYHKLKVGGRKEMISRLIGSEGETFEEVSSSSVSASS
jgi:DNA-binding CsgD family transcriptional regulator